MTQTYLWLIVLAFVVALAWSFWLYKPTKQKPKNLYWLLFVLRAISVFGVLLLLINPILSKKQLIAEKTPLYVLIDNSQSIKNLKAEPTINDIVETLKKDNKLKNNFDVSILGFDEQLVALDSINYKGKQTDIGFVGKQIKDISINRKYPIILVTDGNQTKGKDYLYSFFENQHLYPIVVGDTSMVVDWKIDQINTNKYSLYQNKFPVEVFVNYQGNKASNAQVLLKQGNQIIQKTSIQGNKNQKSSRIEWLVDANKVGVQTYQIEVISDIEEKNTQNNTKYFAVEIIDQKKSIAIISNIVHPDIGAINKAISSNQYRNVKVVKPNEINNLEDFSAVVLYQPDANFKTILNQIKQQKINYWLITGKNTDFNLINSFQSNISFKPTGQKEDYLAELNKEFKYFVLDNNGFEKLPPLEHPFVNISTNGYQEIIAFAKIRNVKLEQPLWSVAEDGAHRMSYLMGENIWRWRMQSYLNNKNFESFDLNIDKLIQFLSSNQTRKRLEVDAENFYNQGDNILIKATYFNKNYEVDTQAQLNITLNNLTSRKVKKYEMYQGSQSYFFNFENLEPGKYSFEVTENNSKISQKGSFEVVPFEAENQFVNANFSKLSQLADMQQGKMFLPSQLNNLINELQNDTKYPTIEKSQITRQQLIEWYWLLLMIALTLAIEWFIRKYNGLL